MRIFSSKILLVCFVVITLFPKSHAEAKERRHIVILQDNSGSFFRSTYSKEILELQKKISNIFDGGSINENYCLLNNEIDQGIHFFNPITDNISFFWFVANQLNNIEFRDNTDGDYRFFENYFFKPAVNPIFQQSGLTVEKYLDNNFSNRPFSTATDKGHYYKGLGSYSLTSFAFPLCLDILNTSYAEEYIFIIISDFKAGSTFGNKQDEKIFKEAFRKNSKCILERVKWLNSQFFKIEYFDDYLDVPNGMLGFTAFKIKPNAGKPFPENVDIRINSNIEFIQNEYMKESYSMLKSDVVFKHNNKLRVDSVCVYIKTNHGEPYKVNITENMIYDKEAMLYSFSNINNIKLQHVTNENQKITGNVEFVFYTRYILDDSASIGYIYDLTRSINHSSFIFQTQLTLLQINIMIILALFSLIAITAIILYFVGKPRGLLLRKNNFTDNYETIDFTSNGLGRVCTDYRSWTNDDETKGNFKIKVRGRLDYKQYNKFYNWNEQSGYNVNIYPLKFILPEGFDGYVKWNTKSSNSQDMPIKIDTAFIDNCFEFDIVFVKHCVELIAEPIYFNFKVGIECYNTGLRKFHVQHELSYSFHVGPKLGHVWLGIDPGTTGSCVATATQASDLIIERDNNNKDRIFPSVVFINGDNIQIQNNEEIRAAAIFGSKANSLVETQNRRKFVSIKKLLGYNELFTIKDQPEIKVDSSFLSTLLIEGLLKQHKEFIEDNKIEYPQFVDNDGSYVPQRASIAIPNNFTASKIQRLKECVLNIDGISLKEIRFIYEAEAILVNYINKHTSNITAQESVSGENIFIFDMGGATINATLVNVKRRKTNIGDWIYKINIINKLGYGIGGDTIDYAFLQWIFSKKEQFSVLAKNDPFNIRNDIDMSTRHKLKNAVLKLKINTIKNYNKKESMLIDRLDITNFNAFKLNPILDSNGDLSSDPFFTECNNNQKSFLYSNIFKTYVWDNVVSIVKDVMITCKEKEVEKLDTVIMSGRSSHFPRIKELVEETIKNASFSPKISLLELEESKSAVAKGACYYGTQNDKIILQNMSNSGVFGVVQTLSPNSPSNFYSLITDGAEFDDNGIISGQATIVNEKKFGWDGHIVKFCQVMGVNPQEIITNNEKHKYSEIATIPADPYPVQSVEIKVTNKDKIICSTTSTEGNIVSTESTICDLDIMACNDEQYTFFVKQS